MKNKHILVISQYFYPEPFRINDLCQEWIKRGYKITVLTGIPNYPRGSFYEGYGFWKKNKELWHGIDIIRIPLLPRGNNSVGLIFNYISFVLSGFIWQLVTKVRADYVFTFEVSPMTQALIGVWYSKRYKVPNYLYVQDLWPENVEIITGIHNPLIIKPINKMVDYIYKNSDELFATSPSFVDAICNRKIRIDRNKVHYWPQYAEEFYCPIKKSFVQEIPNDHSFKIIFTGNIGYAQGLEILLDTAEVLIEEDIKFVIVGDGRYKDEFIKEIIRRKLIKKFILISRQPAERVPELLKACDVAFLSFKNTKLFEMTIPAKLQSYIACGVPIIASASGETKKIIEEAECGICCKIGDYTELIKGIQKIKNADLENMGKSARDYYETHFDKNKLMEEIDFYFQ